MTTEQERLQQTHQQQTRWKRWGPYVSERQWGTVREDYSAGGDAWTYLPHDQARSKAYRWGEDGLAGICDDTQYICFVLALWNGHDPILKERLFGLSGPEGNHGEDVKEYYYYLDNTPTHSYMKYLYKYPQAAYPYSSLVEENGRRDRSEPEYELIDTGIFADERYFDVFVEYAKADTDDILIRLTLINRGPEEATLDLLPTLWFRNTWAWKPDAERPSLHHDNHAATPETTIVRAEHPSNGQRWLYCEGTPPLLFTENETNTQRLYNVPNPTPYVKDSIHEYIVAGKQEAVNHAQVGTKVAAHYHLTLAAGEQKSLHLRFSDKAPEDLHPFDAAFEETFAQRLQEANDFYATVIPSRLSDDEKLVQRQAFAGMLWNKQFYFYDVRTWLHGDPTEPPPPAERLTGRNSDWRHLYNMDVISMPDSWEYPWYASWDLAFQCVVLAPIDVAFAKEQLLLLLREWYMHANGQIPAYEWDFGAANPPLHAWAAYRIYKIEEQQTGKGDRAFLERVFQKLLLNFTWWVNQRDYAGKNVFQGGFLGLDNIGVFDRSRSLPDGAHIEQSDGTSWMGMYCLNMLSIAMELAREDAAYSDIASKFFEHFMYIAHAMNHAGPANLDLWDEQDGFYYDVLHSENNSHIPLKVRSMVGLIPLFATVILDMQHINQLPSFKWRMQWFIDHWEDSEQHMERKGQPGQDEQLLLSLVNRQKLPRILKYMLAENEFLSPYGIRSLSQYHREHPFVLQFDSVSHSVDYEPAESTTAMFGGNSNWRGPIWFPLNYLIIGALQTYAQFYGETFKVEFPTGSGSSLSLQDSATELSHRLTDIFLCDKQGRRPVYGGVDVFQHGPHWQRLLQFYEYFHGDNGAGIGASHQTGWTGLVALLLQSNDGKGVR